MLTGTGLTELPSGSQVATQNSAERSVLPMLPSAICASAAPPHGPGYVMSFVTPWTRPRRRVLVHTSCSSTSSSRIRFGPEYSWIFVADCLHFRKFGERVDSGGMHVSRPGQEYEGGSRHSTATVVDL